MKKYGLLLLLTLSLSYLCSQPISQGLKVSENQRFLVKEDGTPFFWLADTAWELLHRCTRDQAVMYLRKRAEQGFNVVQCVALAELDGLQDPNPYGEVPLIDLDPTQPHSAYFEHVDYVVDQAPENRYVHRLVTYVGR